MSEIKKIERFELNESQACFVEPCSDGDLIYYSDYAELEKKYEALVAENAALKHAIEFATAPDMWEEHGNLLEYKYVDWYVDELNKALNTPTTTQAINEIKARGVDEFSDELGLLASHYRPTTPHYRIIKATVFRAVKFAASLRGGE